MILDWGDWRGGWEAQRDFYRAVWQRTTPAERLQMHELPTPNSWRRGRLGKRDASSLRPHAQKRVHTLRLVAVGRLQLLGIGLIVDVYADAAPHPARA